MLSSVYYSVGNLPGFGKNGLLALLFLICAAAAGFFFLSSHPNPPVTGYAVQPQTPTSASEQSAVGAAAGSEGSRVLVGKFTELRPFAVFEYYLTDKPMTESEFRAEYGDPAHLLLSAESSAYSQFYYYQLTFEDERPLFRFFIDFSKNGAAVKKGALWNEQNDRPLFFGTEKITIGFPKKPDEKDRVVLTLLYEKMSDYEPEDSLSSTQLASIYPGTKQKAVFVANNAPYAVMLGGCVSATLAPYSAAAFEADKLNFDDDYYCWIQNNRENIGSTGAPAAAQEELPMIDGISTADIIDSFSHSELGVLTNAQQVEHWSDCMSYRCDCEAIVRSLELSLDAFYTKKSLYDGEPGAYAKFYAAGAPKQVAIVLAGEKQPLTQAERESCRQYLSKTSATVKGLFNKIQPNQPNVVTIGPNNKLSVTPLGR